MNTDITPRQKQFLQRLNDAHQRLLASIAGLDEDTLCTVPVAGEWTIKDIFGHLVSWDDEFRREIREILAGRHPGLEDPIPEVDDFTDWNQRQAADKKVWSWAAMLADFERDMAEAAKMILSLSPADYRRRGVPAWKQPAAGDPEALRMEDTESVASIITWHWRHLHEHAREIERWRQIKKNFPDEKPGGVTVNK